MTCRAAQGSPAASMPDAVRQLSFCSLCCIHIETSSYSPSLCFLCIHRQVVTTPDGEVEMGLNIAPQNHREAALAVGLALFVILELTVFIGVLNNTAMDLLVKPVAAILHVIRTQAGKVMAALDRDDVSHHSPMLC